MMISTKGRYALRVMIDLAEHREDGYIPMKEVADRQEISLKYLERILPVLSKNNLVEGIHGKGGGYRLSRAPEEYTVGEISALGRRGSGAGSLFGLWERHRVTGRRIARHFPCGKSFMQ